MYWLRLHFSFLIAIREKRDKNDRIHLLQNQLLWHATRGLSPALKGEADLALTRDLATGPRIPWRTITLITSNAFIFFFPTLWQLKHNINGFPVSFVTVSPLCTRQAPSNYRDTFLHILLSRFSIDSVTAGHQRHTQRRNYLPCHHSSLWHPPWMREVSFEVKEAPAVR